MSLTSYIGAVRKNILKPSPELCKVVMMSSPIISDRDLDILRHLEYKGFRTITLPMLFPVGGDGAALEKALGELCRAAEKAVDDGYNYMILSDRGVDAAHAAIPSLLAMSAVHHYLISRRKRSQIAVIVESGEVCETMHVALLMGYGASGVNPYMAFAILKALTASGELQLDFEAAERHYIKAVDKGMLKIMSKMGISTIRSYRGAALFEPLGVGEKLVAESGVGTIAAGVAKAKADKILISGCDGGTGASPADSMKYAGVPVEIGLAEIQQTLVLNRLRGRVRLQADGQLKCARDVLVSALLGAEEYGFGTAALVALGCRMLRKCHTNTCPMGVATQDPQLRECFTGTADRLINYFRLLAEDIRRRIAELGYERLDDLIGRSDLLRQRTAPPESPVARLDLRRLLHRPADIRCRLPQEHALAEVPDQLHCRKHPALRGDGRRSLHRRTGRRTFLRAQQRRHGRRRGRGRPRLRIHDRRPCGRARTDRAQLRGRHERRHRLRLEPARRFRLLLQHGDGRTDPAGQRRRPGGTPSADRGARPSHRQPHRTQDARRVGTLCAPVHQGDSGRIPPLPREPKGALIAAFGPERRRNDWISRKNDLYLLPIEPCVFHAGSKKYDVSCSGDLLSLRFVVSAAGQG